jgi:Tfp pilus assembly protein PilO
MAIDLKQGIDLKDLGPKIKALFSKDSDFFKNKLVVFSIVSILITLILIYLTINILDNQSLFDQAKSKYDQASSELNRTETKFKKIVASNKVYFNQLRNGPKTKSQLSADVTTLVSQYNLTLQSINLNARVGKKKGNNGVKLVISGSYLNLIRFSSGMNKVLAASKLEDLSIKKATKGNALVMTLSIIFAPPPSPSALPIPKKTKKTVKLFDQEDIFNSVLDIFISSANAVEVEKLPPLEKDINSNGISLFQKAYSDAASKGLSEFEFTNKAGETKVYATHIKPSEKIVSSTEEVEKLPPLEKDINNNGISLFQKAYSDAASKGLSEFEFTNKAGETKVYATHIKPSKETVVAYQETQAVKLPEILPAEEVEKLPPLEIPSSKKVTSTKKIKTKKSERIENIKFPKAKSLDDFQKAYVNALIEGQKMFEYTDKKGKTLVYKTDEKGFKAAGFVENDPFKQKSETLEPSAPSAPAENLRDPFAAPGTSAPKVNKSGGGTGTAPETQYYLSGVLTSESTELCVVITPVGESKIYHVGDNINNRLKITGIYANAIMINGLSRKILIGDEIR